MQLTKIYQTLEDRGNPDYVEGNGPFSCRTSSAWLGDGYYFWDSFVENAHWWGQNNNSKNYIVCEASCILNSVNCFDLVANVNHLQDLQKAFELFKSKSGKSERILFPRIIAFLQKQNLFPYSAIRAYPINSKVANGNRVYFKDGNKSYMDLIPPIQICIYKLKEVTFKNYRIIHPDYYCQDTFV